MADPDVQGGLQLSKSASSICLARPHWGVIIPIYCCNNANIFHVQKNKEWMENNAVADYESMCLSSVLWVWMCAFLYIQISEAAIRGFLPKNTDVEKTERAQEIFDSTLTDKMRKFIC